jgi:CopG family transcriptional regulator/antitoxin EndoAI
MMCIVGPPIWRVVTVHRRINITLPEKTIRLIDRVAKKGDRSFLISEAVHRYVASMGKTRLRRLLKEGAIRNAERDLKLAEDWSSLDGATWREDQD